MLKMYEDPQYCISYVFIFSVFETFHFKFLRQKTSIN